MTDKPDKKYDYIRICLGYPNKKDSTRIIWRKWNGVKTGRFETDLFGEIHCYAIDVWEWVRWNQHLSPALNLKKVLTLNLKRKYWEQIRDGEKHMEYREIKPYWTKRLLGTPPPTGN